MKNVYELMENDEGEIMLLLFEGNGAPENAKFRVNATKKYLELRRNGKDIVILDGLVTETVEKLKTITTIYVCEMKYNEDPEAKNEIIYAYPATLKTNTAPKNNKQTSEQNPTLTEKAKLAREKILKNK